MTDSGAIAANRPVPAAVTRVSRPAPSATGCGSGSPDRRTPDTMNTFLPWPLTTWILNLIYGSRYSDIHCGMRAMSREALVGLGLESQSWEYASEMVLKAARMASSVLP